MGAQAWPFNYTNSGDPAYTARQLRQLSVAPFVAMGTTARPLGAKSGIRVGTPSTVASITGSGAYSWNAGGFGGVIDGEANAAAGPYSYSFDTTQTGAIAAAGSAARTDRVDVQISDSDEGDGSGAKSVQPVYTQGAATGGQPPAAPARSHRLFLINVPTSGAPTITWAPDWCGDPGEWTFNTYTELTAYTTAITAANVPAGQIATILADPTASFCGTWYWSGTVWAQWESMGASALTPASIFTPTSAQARVQGGRVQLNGHLTNNQNVSVLVGWNNPVATIADSRLWPKYDVQFVVSSTVGAGPIAAWVKAATGAISVYFPAAASYNTGILSIELGGISYPVPAIA